MNDEAGYILEWAKINQSILDEINLKLFYKSTDEDGCSYFRMENNYLYVLFSVYDSYLTIDTFSKEKNDVLMFGSFVFEHKSSILENLVERLKNLTENPSVKFWYVRE